MSYIELLNHPDYEILNEYPFIIRRKKDSYEISESIANGYIVVTLNGVQYYKHRLVALQFIPNDDPNNKTDVDHINKHRDDYHVENLRWVTSSDNCRNKTSHKGVKYEYIDDIPDNSMVVDFYDTRTERHEFNKGRYYYYYDEELDDDIFYSKVTDELFRKLHINENKSGNKFISMKDDHDKSVSVYVIKFKRQHDLI